MGTKEDQIKALREARYAPTPRLPKADLKQQLVKSIAIENAKAARRRGRPPKPIKTEVQLGIRFTEAQLAKIDAYCKAHGDITRPEAVRRMIDGEG